MFVTLGGTWRKWATSLSLLAMPCASQAVTLDVLVLYDSHTRSYFNGQPETAIRSWVDQVNTMYQNSQMDVRLRLVGTLQHEAPGNNMGEVLGGIRTNGTVVNKRNEVGADFVTQLHRHGSCGVAYLAVSSEWAYSVVGPKCGPYTLAHELGHTQGLNHSRRQGDTRGSRYDYALGHGVDGLFGTIMTYNWLYNAPRVAKFSNPRVSCSGVPCGVPAGQPQQADAAQAVNNVRAELANFRPTRVGGGGTTPTNPDGAVANGVYLLVSKIANRCADVAGAGTADGSNVHHWNCHSGNNQRWIATHLGSGFYELKAKHSGKCLDVRFSGTQNGTNIQQWSCNRSNAQQWKIESNGDGSYRLVSRNSGSVMDTSSADNGANIHQWAWHGGNNQRWTLQRVE